MKTKCHCVYCTKHPKWGQDITPPTGFEPGHMIFGGKESAADVDCLEPASNAFWEFSIEPEDHAFPDTAYGDGCSMTGFDKDGIRLYATCQNEDYTPAKEP